MLLIIYCLVVFLVAFVTLKVADTAQRLDLPPVLTSCIVSSGLVYLSFLIPGALGILYMPVIYSTFIALALLVLLLLHRFKPCEFLAQIEVSVTSFFEYILILIGLLAAHPLLRQINISWPWALRHPNENLGWDTVSYHLPGLIEFLQKHSLWSLDGPYQSYSYCFEILGNYFSMPFHTHWGLILADCFAVFLLIISVGIIARTLICKFPLHRGAGWLSCCVLTVGIWVNVHSDSIGDIGKNDVFMAACLMAALAFLLEFTNDESGSTPRRVSLLLLIGTSAGLALATKPSALAFVPFFAFAVCLEALMRKKGLSNAFLAAGAILGLSGLLGGFWLVRNLVVYGQLSAVQSGWDSSLFSNLCNPALYEMKTGSRRFLLGLLATIPAFFFVVIAWRKKQKILPFIFLLFFHITACVAYAMTPHAIFHGDLNSSVWKLRLGMPLFVSAAIIISLSAVYGCALFTSWRGWLKSVALSTAVLCVVLALQYYWQKNPSVGLSGYEVVHGLSETEVYKWVQKQHAPMRIYSAGLRPYGLVGRNWDNALFYDLHSTESEPLNKGITRIVAVVQRFKPDLILISVDPHTNQGSVKKPEVIDWIKEHPDYFEEVFCDDTVSGFRVQGITSDGLNVLIPADFELRMGE